MVDGWNARTLKLLICLGHVAPQLSNYAVSPHELEISQAHHQGGQEGAPATVVSKDPDAVSEDEGPHHAPDRDEKDRKACESHYVRPFLPPYGRAPFKVPISFNTFGLVVKKCEGTMC